MIKSNRKVAIRIGRCIRKQHTIREAACSDGQTAESTNLGSAPPRWCSGRQENVLIAGILPIEHLDIVQACGEIDDGRCRPTRIDTSARKSLRNNHTVDKQNKPIISVVTKGPVTSFKEIYNAFEAHSKTVPRQSRQTGIEQADGLGSSGRSGAIQKLKCELVRIDGAGGRCVFN